jgi:HAD superfamily hydrolase (TIGR01484 family)
LVALDIDGTLLDYRDVISPGVLRAVETARRSDAHVALSTGRPVRWTAPVAEQLRLDGAHHVSSNGAVTFTHAPTALTSTTTFDPAPAVRALLDEVPDAYVAVEVIGRGFRVNREFPTGEISGDVVVEPVHDLVRTPVTRVTVRYAATLPVDFDAVADAVDLRVTSFDVGTVRWLDFAPRHVSKALGLSFVADSLGVHQADVLAIGDGTNDIEMLQWAGHGVAMGQAPVEVKAAADAVTGTLADDGAATEIIRWLEASAP